MAASAAQTVKGGCRTASALLRAVRSRYASLLDLPQVGEVRSAAFTRLRQKSQSSSSVASALPITYDDPDPEKKSWFSSALGESADRIAGFTFVTVAGNIAS